MNYNIRGNVEITASIEDAVHAKLDKLERYFLEDFEATASVLIKTYDHGRQQKIEVTVPTKDFVLRAEDTSEDLYSSIDSVVEKLERQMRKHKTRINKKIREKAQTKALYQEQIIEQSVEGSEQDDEVTIVRTKQFDLKPMDAEEAILQMDLLGHNFFVFTDAGSQRTNIVYKRRDGKYGLIESN